MQKLIKYLLVVWVSLSASFCGFIGHTQISAPLDKIEHEIKKDQNPFDFVQEITDNGARYQKNRNLAKVAQHRVRPKLENSLKHQKTYRGTSSQAQLVYNSLVRKYGQPESIRGQSHVWNIENPDKGGEQADIVTVIMKMEKIGGYELNVDRDRGENGHATWVATRIKKESVIPVKQHATKPLLVFQADND